MSLANIKAKSQGFTIVELLIVVVVIAVLAAITIVSYNGITTRANASAAKASASTVQKKLELYASETGTTGTYPVTFATLTGDSSKSYYLSGVSFQAGDPTSSTTTNTVTYRICGRSSTATAPSNLAGITSGGAITGARVGYWNAETSGIGWVDLGTVSGTVTVGATTHALACFAPAS